MKKRILAILLAVMMLMGTLSLSFVQAADLQYDADGDGESFAIEVESKTIQSTDTEFTADINFVENTGVWAWKFFLVYDKELTVAETGAFTKGEAFADFNPATDPGLKNAAHDIMVSVDFDYADSIANAGLEGNSDWLVTSVYSECADPGAWSTDTGRLCTVTFNIDPASEKDEYTVYAIPATGGWILREEPGHELADDYGFVEILDPACIPGVITVSDEGGENGGGENEEPTYTEPTIVVSDAEIMVGTETADFTLKLYNNPGIWGITGYINYDEKMSLANFENGNIFAAADLALGGPMVAGNEAMKDFDVANNKQAQYTYNALGVSYEGCLATMVYFEPTTFNATTADGVIVNFTLNTASLEEGTYEIAFYFDEQGIIDIDGEGLEIDAVYGTLSVVDCYHEWDQGVTVPATCTTPGSITYTCTKCGDPKVEDIPLLGHDHVAGETVPPTCTVDGYTPYTCTRCGDTYKADGDPALEHSYDEGVVTTPAECGVAGVMTYTCTRNCQEEDWKHEEEIPALEHNYVAGTPVAPTCTEQGYTRYTCEYCGDFSDKDFVDALGHDEYVKDTTGVCGQMGVNHIYCRRCEVYLRDENTEMIEHVYEDVEGTTVEPTCTVDGSVATKCSKCGADSSRVLEKLGHDWDEGSATTPATCTTEGVWTKNCNNGCGETDTSVIPATGHDWDEGSATTPATCTTEGVWTKNCNNGCGETDTSVIPATGHDYDIVETPATCTEDGYTTKTCKRNCGEDEDVVRVPGEAALGHDYQLVDAKDATCTEEGYTGDQVCSRCGDTITGQVIPALGHNDEVKVFPAECGKEGYTVTICTTCNEELTERTDVQPALEHVYADVVTAPTCEEKGYTTYTCTLCGDSYEKDFVDALGHNWDKGVETTAPTTEAEGVKTYTCEVCGETKTEAVAKLEAAEKDEDKKDEDKKEENKTEETKKPTSDQTGDNVMALVLIALVAAVSFAGVVISKKRIFSGK